MAVATPVLLIIFNRPDTTARVWEAIRAVQPPVLLIAADAARHPGEEAQVQAARAITEQVDWPCTLHRRYASTNQGCKWGPYNAISWGFELVEEMIILEDDCLPHPDFFRFCDSMLQQYRYQPRVMHIGGSSFIPFPIDESYYFSKYTHIWGWATWKRAWQNFDISMSAWSKEKNHSVVSIKNNSKKEARFWTSIFEMASSINNNSIWDYQWTFHIWNAKGVCIVPSKNLVSNLGFGEFATHTKHINPIIAYRETFELSPSLIHPRTTQELQVADHWMFQNIYQSPEKNSFIVHLKGLFLKLIRNARP